jgi:hypothetical protein
MTYYQWDNEKPGLSGETAKRDPAWGFGVKEI